ncbi:MAG: efflux RND transporter periplasmic adaptor subunit [Rhodothermaceae bacterium]|nr:efflux RND transporter periplasmic adaptor subunit [Rhodothermaceae bacterium]
MSKTVKRILTGIFILVVIAAIAWPKIKQLDRSAAGPPPAAAQRAVSVEATVVNATTLLDRIETTGTLRANEEVELRSETAGKITRIYFQEGQRVRKGTMLVKTNDSELQAQLRKAEFRLTLAQNREQREKQILDNGGISLEDYEATQNEVNVLRADIELIQAQIEKTQVKAPFDGTIGLRQVSEGSYISTTTVIANIQNVDPVKIDFSIPERYAQRVTVGDEIVFSVEGLQETQRGIIYAIEPEIDANTRTLLIRARCPNPDKKLLPGAFADIDLIFDEIDDALTVPSIAIIPELGGKKVYVLQNGKAVPRDVETGIRTDERVHVTSGLSPQDTVIVTGLQLIRPMANVNATIIGYTEDTVNALPSASS